MITWFYGNTGSGKSSIAGAYAQMTESLHLDGDDLRNIWPELGLDERSRRTQNTRAMKLAGLIESQGFDVVVSTICPYRDQRSEIYDTLNCKFVFIHGGKSGSDYPFEHGE